MHTNNLGILKKEAFRLVDLENQLLCKIQDIPGLLSSDEDADLQTFDVKSLTQNKELLAGERVKLDSMEMVVAVVGTMKAGKSTTINAIVGSEVLPNRNGPMTSIPTLIRHTVGQHIPSVTFSNNAPINALCKQLSDRFRTDAATVEKLYQNSADMAAVIDFVKRGGEVETKYQGQAGIFEFLRVINDLVRICRELDVEFPFANYDEMQELPVIEVEFTSLSEKESGLGKLTLLDTPGPNEAGQKHLKIMLRDQLRKASAVIAVLNYTQLKSQGDEDLRNEVNAIADMAKGRMYAFVNKFDQRTYNDPDEDSVKRMVSNLLSNTIPEDSIFAVSAQQAFLGETIQKFIRENGELPEPDDHPWVEGFARDCFGRQWRAEIGNIDRVLEEARGYWLDSGFSEPLEKVIHTAHENAAYYALESTASKLASLAEMISNYVNGRETALTKTTLELQGHIDSLKSDASRIAALRSDKEEESSELVNALKVNIKDSLAETQGSAAQVIETLFKKGEVEQQEEESKAKNMTQAERVTAGLHTVSDHTKKTTLSDFFDGGQRSKRQANKSKSKAAPFDPKKKLLEFSDKEKASEFVMGVESALKQPVQSLNEDLSVAVKNAMGKFAKKLESEVIHEAEEILNEVSHRLGEDGFDISLKVPASVRSAAFALRAIGMSEGVKTGTKSVTRLRKQKTATGSVKRFFGGIFRQDWGYDEYEDQIEIYRVSLTDLKKRSNDLIKQQASDWAYEVEIEVEQPISRTLTEFFNELEKKVEIVRGDLLQGIADKEKSKDEQAEFLKGLNKMAKTLPGVKEDSGHLHDDARTQLEGRLQ